MLSKIIPDQAEDARQLLLEDGAVDRYIAWRVCAWCYGDLVKRPVEGRKWQVVCRYCDRPTYTVSKNYAERLGQKALAERWEVLDTFPELRTATGLSEDDLIKSLGF